MTEKLDIFENPDVCCVTRGVRDCDGDLVRISQPFACPGMAVAVAAVVLGTQPDTPLFLTIPPHVRERFSELTQ